MSSYKKNIKKRVFISLLLLASLSLSAANDLIYLNEASLQAVQKEIKNYHYFFYSAYLDLIDAADAEMKKAVNPVTNKTQTPPSGDKHDYLSLAPYWWPNPDTEDGLPWIRKDGQVNPDTRGDHTDQVRSSEMFSSVQTLALAYYFSGQERYAEKAYQHIHAWFIDEETLMNPNINYGQAVPGSVDGRAAGIIEFVGVGKLITALQILEGDSILSQNEVLTMKQWMTDMVTWLTTHEYALKENNSNNNHGTWYDYQVLGMYMYIGDTAKALAKAESIKTRRIATQIAPDGSQPEELGRTKSVNYSTMNLRGLSYLSLMAEKVGVDLWNYETSDGRSIRRAYEFLVPYIMKTKSWSWDQITGGGAASSLEDMTVPLFAKASAIFQETLLPKEKSGTYALSYIDKICYPPLDMLNGNDTLKVTFTQPLQDTTVSVSAGLSVCDFEVTLDGEPQSDAALWMSVDGITLKTSSGKRQIWQGNSISHPALGNLSVGTYELKVVARTADGAVAENYLQLNVQPGSSSYSGTPVSLPGTIEAEDYDLGGEGIAYHDSDKNNAAGAYRNDAVDIVQYGDVIALTETQPGEWLNYTVNVAKAAHYDLEFTYYGLWAGSLGVQWAEADTALFEGFILPASNGTGFSSLTKSHVFLAEGENKLRLNLESDGFHLDKITITETSSAGLGSPGTNALKLYPNPTSGMVYLSAETGWTVYSISGLLLLSGHGAEINLSDQPAGIYLLQSQKGMAKVLKE